MNANWPAPKKSAYQRIENNKHMHGISFDFVKQWQPYAKPAAVTALIFLLLPLSEYITRHKKKQTLREAETLILRELPPKRKTIVQKKKKRQKPKLDKSQRRLSIQKIAASLSLGMGDTGGDFSLNFAMNPSMGKEDMVFELSDVEKPPTVTSWDKPVYPLGAKNRKIEGRVVLMFVVSAKGRVQKETIRITESVPPGVFDKAARSAVAGWRFQPGIRQGKAVGTRVEVPLKFQLSQ